MIDAILLVFPLLAGVLLFGGRLMNQERHDHQRSTYRIEAFPLELDEADVGGWLRSLKGLSRGSLKNFWVPITIVPEVWGTGDGLTYRLRVPTNKADYICAQLQSHVPGLRLVPEDDPPAHEWKYVAEIALKGTAWPLDIESIERTARTVRTPLFQGLHAHEQVLLQTVLGPARKHRLPELDKTQSARGNLGQLLSTNFLASRDEIAERRQKLAEPNFPAVLRIAAHAHSPERAAQLVANVQLAIDSARGTESRFTRGWRRWLPQQTLHQRISSALTPFQPSAQLSLSEILALLAWPIGESFELGVPISLAKHLPPTSIVLSTGRVLGIATMPNYRRNVAVSYSSTVRHMYCVGLTGAGKTNFLTDCALQDIHEDCGVLIVESKSGQETLLNQVLPRIPRNRWPDVIIVDVNDTVRPVGFNLFDQGNTRASIDEFGTLIFDQMFRDANRTVTAPPMFYYMMNALGEVAGSTFIDLPILMAPADTKTDAGAWRWHVADQVKNAEAKEYLNSFLKLSVDKQNTETQALRNRIWEFTARPEIRTLLGQRHSSFNMKDVIAQNKILLVDVSGGSAGSKTSSILGTLLVKAIWDAAQTVTPAKPNFLYLDEFASFMNWPVDIEDILRLARSANLGMVLAHQNLTQINPKLRAGVLANTATKVVFRTSAVDASQIAPEFGGRVDREAFPALPRFEALALIGTDTGYAPPVSISTRLLPARSPEALATHARQLRRLSQDRYGRDIAAVERDLNTRLAPDKPKRRLPHISGLD